MTALHTPRKRRLLAAAAGLALVLGVAAVLVVRSVPRGADRTSRPVASVAPVDDYRRAVDVALAHHMRVWIEADLVKRWQEGTGPFRDAIDRVAELADRPGVVGVKVADELGYHDGLDSRARVGRFLSATASALHTAAPGKLILVDAVVPELGCLPGRRAAVPAAASCAVDARRADPQLALGAMDGYLRQHAIDVLDLSTGLQSQQTYAAWGTTQDEAHHTAWREVRRRGWASLVHVQARKALAHSGYYGGTASDAAATVHTFVDIPVAEGARAVDVWTWRQTYRGGTYRLMDPGLRANALWDELAKRHRDGVVLATNMSPHSVESGVDRDLSTIATVFTDVLLPAGTG